MNKHEREFIEKSRFLDPAIRKREVRKKNMKKIAGIFVFEMFAFFSLCNFLLGGLFFALAVSAQISALFYVCGLCFINCLGMFLMASESYYVHVAGQNKKRAWLDLQYGDDE